MAQAKASGRPVKYLNSSQTDKETIARDILAHDGVRSGLVCVLSCVEPCWTFQIHRNRENKRLELQLRPGKCLFLYHYQIHPIFGFLNARIQTWFPFSIQICLNGREWLARQMQAAGLDYLQQDNCFPWISDWSKAQRLMDSQLKTPWPKLLNGIARQLNPIHTEIFPKHPISYYWSTYQHEWALDVVFHHAADLRRFYPRWVNHAMTTFSSPDVMRFLGKPITLSGQLRQDFSGEVVSDFKRRAEGVRVKHSVNGNSVKLYDKAYTSKGSVLRAEATFHNGDDFRVYRRKEGDRKGPRAWRPLRRGIADLHRRAQLSHKAAAMIRYDSLSCPQQKCLLHLIRDLNEAVLDYPYDEELKQMATGFAELLRSMVQTIDRWGLRRRFLSKHLVGVDRFYRQMSKADYLSEVTLKFKERFEKNSDKLFTFLTYDGIPWNNNNAEHAIKAFARLRRLIERMTSPKGIEADLILLSVCQTCKYSGVDFLDFLRSGEKDIGAFANQR